MLNFEPFFFYQNDLNKTWHIPADKGRICTKKGFIAIADGLTRKVTRNSKKYPEEFLSHYVSELFVNKAYENFERFDYTQSGMEKLLSILNEEIRQFNLSNGFDYKDPNTYDMGECVGGCAVIKEDIMYYGILEDCYINVLRGNDLQDQVNMDYQMMKSYRYAKNLVEENPDLNFDEVWCKKLRNNPDITDENGSRVGWGCFNGDREAQEFWQIGQVQLQKGDIIWLVTDGMLPLLGSDEIVDYIINKASNVGIESQATLSKMISNWGKELKDGVKTRNAGELLNEKMEKLLIQIKVH